MSEFLDSLAKSGIGILIVFIGLVCLIALVVLMGKIFGLLKAMSETKEGSIPATSATSVPVASAPSAPAVKEIENRDELIVAFSAAVAEELGTDVSAIRVVSFKEIG